MIITIKKRLLVSFLTLVIVNGFSQISIDSSDVAIINQIFYQATDTTPTISIGNAGAAQVWDMSDLHVQKNDTLNFLPYSVAQNPKFSTSNLIVKQGWKNNYQYFLKNLDSLKVLGNSGIINYNGAPLNFTRVNTPSEVILHFPSNFGDTLINNYTTKAKGYVGQLIQGFQVDSARYKSVVYKRQKIDGYGTLITPQGSYSALRIKETQINYDTIDAYVILFPPFGIWQNSAITQADSITTYTWWAKEIGYPIVKVNYDITGTLKNVQWLNTLPGPLGIKEKNVIENISLFPNPAKDNITFVIGNKNITGIKVYDISGRLVDSKIITSEEFILITTTYKNGIYTYSLLDNKNGSNHRGKFSIIK